MNLRKPLALVLSVSMLLGMTSYASNAAVKNDESVSAGNYINGSYLETYANKAYNESDLGSAYSKTSTTWKTWSPEASSVQVKLYKTGSDNESGAGVIGTHNMQQHNRCLVFNTFR